MLFTDIFNGSENNQLFYLIFCGRVKVDKKYKMLFQINHILLGYS